MLNESSDLKFNIYSDELAKLLADKKPNVKAIRKYLKNTDLEISDDIRNQILLALGSNEVDEDVEPDSKKLNKYFEEKIKSLESSDNEDNKSKIECYKKLQELCKKGEGSNESKGGLTTKHSSPDELVRSYTEIGESVAIRAFTLSVKALPNDDMQQIAAEVKGNDDDFMNTISDLNTHYHIDAAGLARALVKKTKPEAAKSLPDPWNPEGNNSAEKQKQGITAADKIKSNFEGEYSKARKRLESAFTEGFKKAKQELSEGKTLKDPLTGQEVGGDSFGKLAKSVAKFAGGKVEGIIKNSKWDIVSSGPKLALMLLHSFTDKDGFGNRLGKILLKGFKYVRSMNHGAGGKGTEAFKEVEKLDLDIEKFHAEIKEVLKESTDVDDADELNEKRNARQKKKEAKKAEAREQAKAAEQTSQESQSSSEQEQTPATEEPAQEQTAETTDEVETAEQNDPKEEEKTEKAKAVVEKYCNLVNSKFAKACEIAKTISEGKDVGILALKPAETNESIAEFLLANLNEQDEEQTEKGEASKTYQVVMFKSDDKTPISGIYTAVHNVWDFIKKFKEDELALKYTNEKELSLISTELSCEPPKGATAAAQALGGKAENVLKSAYELLNRLNEYCVPSKLGAAKDFKEWGKHIEKLHEIFNDSPLAKPDLDVDIEPVKLADKTVEAMKKSPCFLYFVEGEKKPEEKPETTPEEEQSENGEEKGNEEPQLDVASFKRELVNDLLKEIYE